MSFARKFNTPVDLEKLALQFVLYRDNLRPLLQQHNSEVVEAVLSNLTANKDKLVQSIAADKASLRMMLVNIGCKDDEAANIVEPSTEAEAIDRMISKRKELKNCLLNITSNQTAVTEESTRVMIRTMLQFIDDIDTMHGTIRNLDITIENIRAEMGTALQPRMPICTYQ